MYCIYYNKDYDVGLLGEVVDGDVKLSIYNLKEINDKLINGELNIENLNVNQFKKEKNLSPSKLEYARQRELFHRSLLDENLPVAIRLNGMLKFIVIELINEVMYIDICDLEFIKDCIDTKIYYVVSKVKLQERGLGVNDNKDRDSRRKEYLQIQMVEASDCRRKSNITIRVRKIEKGDKKESFNIKSEAEVRTDIKSDDILKKDSDSNKSLVEVNVDTSLLEDTEVSIDKKSENLEESILKGIELDFGEDEEDELLEDEFIPLYSEYDRNCELCHGSGRIEVNGFIKECNCGAEVLRLKKLHEKKEDNKPVFNITNAIKENVISYGLIPDEYRDIEYDDKIIQKILSQKYKGKKVKIQNYMGFVNTLSTIIASCKTGHKLRHSYLIGGDKGFGKKTFVFTCLKYLYARNSPLLCKYISLSELGLLKAEAIKRASAINNLGYYTRDNDRDLVQKTIVEESKRAMNAILNDWFNTIKDSGGLKVALKSFGYKVDSDLTIDEQREELKNQKTLLSKQFENAIIRNAYTRVSEEERIVNYGSEYCGKLVNTWEDYLNAPIVFVYFSGVGERRFETEVLQILLNIRGAKALPTIAIIETGLGIFKDENIFVENSIGDINTDVFKARSYFWDSMLSDASDVSIKKIDKNRLKEEISSNIEYDRMIYIYSYAKYQDKLKVGIDI